MRALDLPTPSLLLDLGIFQNNATRLRYRVAASSAALRPHLKTVKAARALPVMLPAHAGRAAVSTLREAEYFFESGVIDLLYTVGITPDKIGRAAALARAGARLCVIVDSHAMARHLVTTLTDVRLPVLIEIDCDGHRAGVDPDSDALLEIATLLTGAPGVDFCGVMTHAGAAYECRAPADIEVMARRECERALTSARRIRKQGIACREVSVGSTPTAMLGKVAAGITEVRAGVYYLNDLTMVGLGVCGIADIAATVLASVVGHQLEKQRIILDAGWMALTADRSTASQRVFAGYGVLADLGGRPFSGLGVVDVNQEHGVASRVDGKAIDFGLFPIGSRVRVLPNHACATSAAFREFHVIDAGGEVVERWPRCEGW